MSRALTTEEASIHKTFGEKLTLEEIANVKGIGMLMGRTRYSVEGPVAYRIKGTDSTLIFGELKNPIDIEQLKKMYEARLNNKDGEEVKGLYKKIDDDVSQEPKAQDESEVVSNNKEEETAYDVEEKDERLLDEDIALISSQVKASRKEIVKALVESDYDVVNAMMKLTK